MALPTVDDGQTGLAFRNIINNNFDDLDTRMISEETKTAMAFRDLTPQVTKPAYLEGREYYDEASASKKIMGPFPNVEVSIGHDLHLHVKNESGATITKGMALRQNGVNASGQVLVELAIADSFVNARILGVAASDIPNNTDGAAVTFGEIQGLGALGVPLGVPLYLSDTVAGTYTQTPPDIVSRVGGATNIIDGKLFVYIVNNTSLPQVYAGMQGQTTGGVYSVSAVTQPIINYDSLKTSSIVMVSNESNGEITTSNTGGYRANFIASLEFLSTTSTRTLIFEFTNAITNEVLFPFVKNIPRDAITDGIDFNFPFSAEPDDRFVMRVSSTTGAIDVTFNSVSFDIQSINIR